MSPTLFFLLGLSALVLVVAVEPEQCVQTNKKIILSELDGKVWILQKVLSKTNLSSPDGFKCQKFTLAMDETGQVLKVIYSVTAATNNIAIPDTEMTITQNERDETILTYPDSLKTTLTSLFSNEIGMVIKQTYSIPDSTDTAEVILVVSLKKDVLEPQVAELLEKACVGDLPNKYDINQTSC